MSGIEVLSPKMRGYYLRKHPEGVFGKPDFGNKSRKIALFFDGCFWHACPEHFKMPKSNVEFWAKKMAANRRRDKKVTATLRRRGWTVMRIWEHEL